ncbi:InlB B-repeat-containing protein [Oscillibacter sp.]|uniref:InlB B-repeat-containing protein n=1 Tax=Oscillibacter sp. TaxID=1945593 RepID=UPI0033990D77
MPAHRSPFFHSDGTGILKLYYDRERFTVTYAYTGRSAGDTVPEDAPELPVTASYRYGQTVTLPAQPQSKGTLRFLGWALDGTLTNALDFALEKDVAITGYWYTPTYSDGGGDNDKAAYSAVLIPDSTATDIVLQSDSSNRVTFLVPPEKEGCTFAGWATESGGDAAYHAGDTITLTRNCVFYAVYYRQIAPYIIGFTDNTFRPGSNLTLKQGALMLKRLGVSTQITSSNLYFTRRVFLSLICSATGADTRSQDPMALAVEKGWIIGFTDGTLRSDDYITRAQAATILDRVFRQGDTLVKDGRSFADIPQTHWASDAISRASATSTIRV